MINRPFIVCALAGALLAATGCRTTEVARARERRVELVRTPDNGIQPQAVIDPQGTVHLVYYRGEAAAGDLFYRRRAAGEEPWSEPLRVNTVPGSAVAAGSIRGGQLALGKEGRVHVVWFGSGKAGQKGPEDSAPVLYARLNDGGTVFEPQRNLMRTSSVLDGGPSVAADRSGSVFVVWQAAERAGEGEELRRVWAARSRDDGRTFSPETPAWSEPTGACPCCSVKAFADSRGALFALYRAARGGVDRDMYLLASKDRGSSFKGARLDPWNVNT
jgi:hypothetical protein